MALTDLAIRHARPLGKAYRLSDCHGLYIQVNPSGSKLWYVLTPKSWTVKHEAYRSDSDIQLESDLLISG